MSKYIVLSAKPYNFESSDGNKISGVKIAYLNRKPSPRDGEYGNPPLITKCSLDAVKDVNIKDCPAVFDLDFEQVTGKNNKPELLLTSLDYVAHVDFDLFFENN